MISECPHCRTQFNVTDEQLNLAEGDVRCGKCLAVFSAHKHQVNVPTPSGSSVAALEQKATQHNDKAQSNNDTDAKAITREWLTQLLPSENNTDTDDLSNQLTDKSTITKFAQNARESELNVSANDAKVKTDTSETGDQTLDLEDSHSSVNERIEPSLNPSSVDIDLNQFESLPIDIAAGSKFAGGKKKHLRQKNLVNRLLSGFLFLLFLLLAHYTLSTQTTLIPRDHIFHAENNWAKLDRKKRDKIVAALSQVRCRLTNCASDKNPLYSVEQLIIGDHAELQGKLTVEAIITNKSAIAQPFPTFEVRFSNIEGEILAIEKVEPTAYLKGEATELNVMPIDTPIHISVEIADPGETAVNYSARLQAHHD